MHRAIRWLVQAGFLGLFVFLFVQTRYGVRWSWGDAFFRFDPLVFGIVSIAQRAVFAAGLWSLAVVAGTVVFGRFFCGWVCPLGTAIDAFDAAAGAKGRSAKGTKGKLLAGKYLFVLLLVVAALLGSASFLFLDPLVTLERTLALVFYPALSRLVEVFRDVRAAVFTESAIAGGLFVMILGLGLVVPRFWCRSVCPLGGLLGFLAKFSLFKLGFAHGCRQCGACERVCPTGAIEAEEERIDSGECIGCLVCLYRCGPGAVRYRLSLRPSRLRVGWRPALVVAAAALFVAPLAQSTVNQRTNARLIRPPASVPEADFVNLCLRCGRCLKVCPTNGLQPAAPGAGIWTPRLVARVGGCEKNCNMCGLVCPTGAIRRLDLDEKSYARLGTAVVERGRCIAWEQDRVCLICDEACPYNAIEARAQPGVSVLCPIVDEQICVGCGLCESRCPIEGSAAIQVYASGEERRKAGGYKTDERARLRQCGEEPAEDIPAGFIQE